jgi:hypothetical protein
MEQGRLDRDGRASPEGLLCGTAMQSDSDSPGRISEEAGVGVDVARSMDPTLPVPLPLSQPLVTRSPQPEQWPRCIGAEGNHVLVRGVALTSW